MVGKTDLLWMLRWGTAGIWKWFSPLRRTGLGTVSSRKTWRLWRSFFLNLGWKVKTLRFFLGMQFSDIVFHKCLNIHIVGRCLLFQNMIQLPCSTQSRGNPDSVIDAQQSPRRCWGNRGPAARPETRQFPWSSIECCSSLRLHSGIFLQEDIVLQIFQAALVLRCTQVMLLLEEAGEQKGHTWLNWLGAVEAPLVSQRHLLVEAALQAALLPLVEYLIMKLELR